MNPKEIERFFNGVAKDFKGRATVFLTGAAAGSLMGGVRPSFDIDFGVKIGNSTAKKWRAMVSAIEKNERLAGITTNFGEDIDRWGQISLLDYQKHAKFFKQFGNLAVKVLEPAYWSIGKMTRYLAPDIQDMEAVFKSQKVQAADLAGVWGRALKGSPRSAKLSLFRRQVEHFLSAYGPKIWGKGFNPSKSIEKFHQSAGILRTTAKKK